MYKNCDVTPACYDRVRTRDNPCIYVPEHVRHGAYTIIIRNSEDLQNIFQVN